jgi:hypothetical protein
MYLYLNINNVIIDVVDVIRPVMKNCNGIVVECCPDEAQGYMGTNEKIYAKVGYNFVNQFEDISNIQCVDIIPSYVIPRVFKYENEEFVEADKYELPAEELTNDAIQQRADIDYIAMEMGVDLDV